MNVGKRVEIISKDHYRVGQYGDISEIDYGSYIQDSEKAKIKVRFEHNLEEWFELRDIKEANQKEEDKLKRWVKAIREDKDIGKNTCSMIDECQSEQELIAMFKHEEIKTKAQAIKMAKSWNKLYFENEQEKDAMYRQ